MQAVTGVFKSQEDADVAVNALRSLGIPEKRLGIVAPGSAPERLEAGVPVTDSESPGMGRAMGAAVGGGIGAAGGARRCSVWAARRPVRQLAMPSRKDSAKAYRTRMFTCTRIRCGTGVRSLSPTRKKAIKPIGLRRC